MYADATGASGAEDEPRRLLNDIESRLKDRIRDDQLRSDVAWFLALLTKQSHDRRVAHQYLSLAHLGIDMTNDDHRERLLQPVLSGVDMGALIRILYDHGRQGPSSPEVSPQNYKRQSLSMELGHVDQYGDWRAAHELDEAIRELGRSDALERHGFEVAHIYDKGDERTRYSFIGHRVQHPGGVAKQHPTVLLHGVRKRPVVDIRCIAEAAEEDGRATPIIQVVKRSSFVIVRDLLSATDRAALSGPHGESHAVAIIEGALEEGARGQQGAVLPASALEYARIVYG